jgi:hypothetical protein
MRNLATIGTRIYWRGTIRSSSKAEASETDVECRTRHAKVSVFFRCRRVAAQLHSRVNLTPN